MADKTISGLTALPGTLDPAALVAIVQSGVTYKATGQQVIDMVFGNISVIENANGVSVRVAGKFQVCWAYLNLAGLAAGETLDHVWEFPEAFPLASPLPIVVPVASTTSNIPRSVAVSSASGDWLRGSAKLFIRDDRPTGSSVSNRVMVVAISRL